MGCTISDNMSVEESKNPPSPNFAYQHQNQERRQSLLFPDHKMNSKRRSSWLDDEVCWQMSNKQINCVKETWKLMEHHQEEIGKIVTDRLVKSDKELAFVFQITLSSASKAKKSTPMPVESIDVNTIQSRLPSQRGESAEKNRRRNSIAVNNRFLVPHPPNKEDLSIRRRSYASNDNCLNEEIGDARHLDNKMLHRHTNSVLQALGAAVDCLDECLALNRILLALGRAHSEFELLKSDHYFRLWDPLDYAFRQYLGALYSKEVCQSWKIVFKYLVRKMCEGASLPPRGDPLAPKWCRLLEEDEHNDNDDDSTKQYTDSTN